MYPQYDFSDQMQEIVDELQSNPKVSSKTLGAMKHAISTYDNQEQPLTEKTHWQSLWFSLTDDYRNMEDYATNRNDIVNTMVASGWLEKLLKKDDPALEKLLNIAASRFIARIFDEDLNMSLAYLKWGMNNARDYFEPSRDTLKTLLVKDFSTKILEGFIFNDQILSRVCNTSVDNSPYAILLDKATRFVERNLEEKNISLRDFAKNPFQENFIYCEKSYTKPNDDIVQNLSKQDVFDIIKIVVKNDEDVIPEELKDYLCDIENDYLQNVIFTQDFLEG